LFFLVSFIENTLIFSDLQTCFEPINIFQTHEQFSHIYSFWNTEVLLKPKTIFNLGTFFGHVNLFGYPYVFLLVIHIFFTRTLFRSWTIYCTCNLFKYMSNFFLNLRKILDHEPFAPMNPSLYPWFF
jgi:hypothetical protein